APWSDPDGRRDHLRTHRAFPTLVSSARCGARDQFARPTRGDAARTRTPAALRALPRPERSREDADHRHVADDHIEVAAHRDHQDSRQGRRQPRRSADRRAHAQRSLRPASPRTRRVNARRGKVWLVGAGPGDPGLLTLKGARAIQTCDTLVYDYLASQAIV